MSQMCLNIQSHGRYHTIMNSQSHNSCIYTSLYHSVICRYIWRHTVSEVARLEDPYQEAPSSFQQLSIPNSEGRTDSQAYSAPGGTRESCDTSLRLSSRKQLLKSLHRTSWTSARLDFHLGLRHTATWRSVLQRPWFHFYCSPHAAIVFRF